MRSSARSSLVRRAVSWTLLWGLGLVIAPVDAVRAEQNSAEQNSPELSGKTAELYQAGRVLYSEGNYKASARKLRRAHERNPQPILLYNLALAEWRAGHIERALELARLVDKSEFPDSLATKNRAMVRGLETHVAAGTVAKRAATVAATTDDGADSAPETGDAREQRTGTGSDRRLRRELWAGVGLLGLGTVSLGGAVWTERRLVGTFDAYRRAAQRGDGVEYRRLRAEIRRQQRLAIGLLGGGLVVSGVGVYFLVRSGVGPFSDRGEMYRRPGYRLFPSIIVDSNYVGMSLQICSAGAC